MKTIFSIILLILLQKIGYSQTILFNQGFENPRFNTVDNWGYQGGNRSLEKSKEGLHSLIIGRYGLSNQVIFNSVNISQYPNNILQISHSVGIDSIVESGLDDLEGIAFQVSLDGNNWITISKISGNNNYNYTFNDTIADANSSTYNCRVFKTPNPLNYQVPQGTTTISVRIISVRAIGCRGFNYNADNGIESNYDRTDEGFYIDNVRIITNEQSSTFPVQMVDFYSEIRSDNIELNWITASEINTKKFSIERSNNGISFEEIGYITANNLEDLESHYYFMDEMPQSGDNYYRLKIIDLDETIEYSNIIHNFFERDFDVTIYPNPILAGQSININTNSKIEKLVITDINGRAISTNKEIPINTSPGIYLVNLQIGNTLLTNKIQIK